MFQEGDVVEIPLPNERTAVARIIHISQRTKGAVGFIVLGIKGQIDKRNTDKKFRALGPMYTSLDAAEHYGWKTIEHIPMNDRDRELTRRKVGGGVYVGDEYIGSVEKLHEENLKPMLLYGMVAVHNAINKAFAAQEPNLEKGKSSREKEAAKGDGSNIDKRQC